MSHRPAIPKLIFIFLKRGGFGFLVSAFLFCGFRFLWFPLLAVSCFVVSLFLLLWFMHLVVLCFRCRQTLSPPLLLARVACVLFRGNRGIKLLSYPNLTLSCSRACYLLLDTPYDVLASLLPYTYYKQSFPTVRKMCGIFAMFYCYKTVVMFSGLSLFSLHTAPLRRQSI